jgi:hypothetical protein
MSSWPATSNLDASVEGFLRATGMKLRCGYFYLCPGTIRI